MEVGDAVRDGPSAATSRETSFVMSITDSDGRAAAIEKGTSMLVMRCATSFGSLKWTSSFATSISSSGVADLGEPRRGRRTSSSGVEAPAVRPTVSCPSKSSGRGALAVDERRLRACGLRDLDEPLRVRARLRADHEDERRALRDHRLHRVLAVLRRVTDVVGGRPPQRAEVVLERVDDRSDVVEGERRLRDHRDGLVGVELARLLRRLDHDRRVRPLAERPDHLDVVLVADERDEMAAVGVAPRLGVHLVHERARRVDDRRPRCSAFSFTAGATPCAERTQISPSGISSSSSTKTAPSSSSRRTTCSLWTIWWRT